MNTCMLYYHIIIFLKYNENTSNWCYWDWDLCPLFKQGVSHGLKARYNVGHCAKEREKCNWRGYYLTITVVINSTVLAGIIASNHLGNRESLFMKVRCSHLQWSEQASRGQSSPRTRILYMVPVTTIRICCQIFLEMLALSPCRVIRRVFHILETWLLSNILISQMEKQHLFSCSFAYGYQCCLGKLKQVAHVKEPLGSTAVCWEWIAVDCCEGAGAPQAGKLHI